MTELVEGVALGAVSAQDVDCPFHDKEHEHDGAKNVLIGNATTLGSSLVKGADATSTVVRKSEPDSRYRKELRKEADPDERPEEQREVQLIEGNEDTWYPTGFQAHHLIPAKESLARATSLLRFIRKGKKACCNLGYDVNGNQNGAWLPGKHAVDGNGLDLWKGGAKPGPDNEGTPRSKTSRGRGKEKWSYIELKGPRPGYSAQAFSEKNMRWLYVWASMNSSLGRRQFHDRHPHYSGKVKDHLDALGAVLEKLSGTDRKPATCDKCTNQKVRQPPVALLGALNGLSDHYRRKVVGDTKHAEFYTSSWCDPARMAGPVKQPKMRPRAVRRK